MFAVFINNMVENVTSYVSLFADDAKLLCKVKDNDDCEKLQSDLDKVCDWSTRWQIEFNNEKCKKTEFGKSSKGCSFNYKLGHETIKKATEEKDFGVIFSEDLSPEKHINKITGKTLNLLKKYKNCLCLPR